MVIQPKKPIWLNKEMLQTETEVSTSLMLSELLIQLQH